MKTTKVKSVQGNKSFESKYGAEQPDGKKLLFSYDYEFEDGVFLSANHKTVPSPFKVGDTVEYEVTRESEQYGKSGKVSKPDMSVYSKSTMPTSDSLQGVKIGHAITNAVQMVSNLDNPKDLQEGNLETRIKRYARMILKIGEELNAEISKVESPTTIVVPKGVILTSEELPPAEDYRNEIATNGDIPF